MKVKEAMHQGTACVDVSTPITDVAKFMRDKDVGAIPVTSGDKIVGIITDRDITCRLLADGGDATQVKARDIMTKNVACCSAEDEIDEAIEKMETKKIRRLPVTDGKDQVVGMLSLGDIANVAGRDLSGEVLRAVSAHHV